MSGNGYTLSFPLSETPFFRAGAVLVNEEYRGSSLRSQHWSTTDPTGAIVVSSGKLHISGGNGQLGATLVRLANKLELAGALVLDHGDFDIAGGSDAIVGGIYHGGFDMAACVAGFRLTPSSGAATQIAAVVNGTVAGQTLTTAAGRKYVLSTRVYADEVYRLAQRFETSSGAIGGNEIPAGARFVLQVHEIDANDPATLVAPATVLYEGWVPDVPACCDYALINTASMQATVSYTRLARVADAEVRTCTSSGTWRNRILGALSEGSECRISGNSLYFFPASAPENGERIVVTYRTAARTVSRVSDAAAISARATGDDDGHRAIITRVASPSPRTFEDADNAALALLRSQFEEPCRGEYTTWDIFLDGDIHPGDALEIHAPSRAAEFSAIVREVEIEAADLLEDHCRVRLRFASESAEPAAMRLEPPPPISVPYEPATTTSVGAQYLDAVKAAEIINAGSTNVMIDTGIDPSAGGGFEVRRSDSGWGLEDDRNLVGRFDYRIFSVPRLSRSQTWFVRQYDGSAPARYSRVSTILHLDYAL